MQERYYFNVKKHKFIRVGVIDDFIFKIILFYITNVIFQKTFLQSNITDI